MQSGAFRRALGLIFLYIGLFVVIVLVQFSKGPGFSEKIGSLSVSATFPKTTQGKAVAAPDSLRLSYAGLGLVVSPQSMAESVAADGSATPLVLASIKKLPNGVNIKFASGAALVATVDKGPPERFALRASAPAGVSAIRLRLVPARSLRFSEAEGRSRIDMEGGTYDVGLSAGSLDGDAGLLTLQAGDAGLALAKIVPAATKPVQATAPEKLALQTPRDPEAFKADIAAWRDKAWSGLSSLRFDPDKVTWKAADGSPAFSERALTAYFAESLARGAFQDALGRARGAKDRWGDRLGYLSAPYLGGLVAKMKGLETADLAESKRLAQLVADGSPTIFEKEGLLGFLIDRGPPSLAQDAFKYFSGVDPSRLTVKQAVGYLACAIDAKALLGLKDEDNPCHAAAAAITTILASLREVPKGLALATEDDGSCDVRASLWAGRLLTNYGGANAKASLVGVGQALVEGYLALTDAQGFAPARVFARAGAIEQEMGSAPPEDLYSLVADNPYYPHEVSFYRDVAPGFWAWTCAPSLTVQSSSSRYVFTATFPAGRSHYLAFYGVKPFANIQLYGIDYSPDSEFESYDASGYLYKKETGALYVKMKHKKDNEDIKLSY